MKREDDFKKLNEEIFDFFNSDMNHGAITGQLKELSVYDIQHLIYRHIGEKEGLHKNAISNRLKRYFEIKDKETID